MECYFQDIEHHIINYIENAQFRILICVAWFTNPAIGSAIIKKSGMDIEIIIDNNEINRKCQNFKSLKANNFDITLVKDLQKKFYLMHNKFCLIDNRLVITGSYNWTINANSNDENISVINDVKIAASYIQEFRRIKDIELPTNNLSLTEKEAKEITNLIYKELIMVIKEPISNGKLCEGLIANWTDFKIINKIRPMDERVRNNLTKKISISWAYLELKRKYGDDYKELVTERDKAIARDKFKKRDLDEIEIFLDQQFSFFKLKALKQLQSNYIKLLDNSLVDEESMRRITNIVMFLNSERNSIAKKLKVNLY